MSILTSIRSRAGNGSKKNTPPATWSGSLFRTLDELPLDRFIRAICDDDLGAIIKEGEIPPVMTLRARLNEAIVNNQDTEIPALSAALEAAEASLIEIVGAAWSDLFLDYLDANKKNEIRLRITLQRDIKVLDIRLSVIETSLFNLQIIYHEEFVNRLRERGFSAEEYPLDPDDKDNYFDDLNNIRTASQEIVIDRDLMILELEELEKLEATKEAIGEKQVSRATRESFLVVLARIATYKHCAVIRTSEISVLEFCVMFNQYLEYIDAVRISNQKRA